MDKQKLKDHESPTTKVFELRFEGIICVSGDFDPNSWGNGSDDWWSDPGFSL